MSERDTVIGESSLGGLLWNLPLEKVDIPCGVPLCTSRCLGVPERKHTISFPPSFKVEEGKAACILGQCLSSVRVHSPKNLCFPSCLPQLFIFIQRKISSEEEAIMAEVHRYRDDQR